MILNEELLSMCSSKSVRQRQKKKEVTNKLIVTIRILGWIYVKIRNDRKIAS